MPTLSRVGEMTSIELSVILPVFNAALFLGAALDALVRQQFSGTWEIIVADNGSTDDTVAVARSYQDRLPNLTIIDASGVQGASYARNCAVDVARGQKLVFVDGDDVPAEGYIETMSAALDENRLVCSRIDVEQLNPRWTNELRPGPQRHAPSDFLYFLPWGGGSTLGAQRDLFEGVGGFDESLLYAEDIDFCWRAQLYGGAELVFVPDALLHVRHRSSLRQIFSQARQWSFAEWGLYLAYRPMGARFAPLRDRTMRWWKLTRHIPRLRHRAGRAWWLTHFGNVIGRLQAGVVVRLKGRHKPISEARRPRAAARALS